MDPLFLNHLHFMAGHRGSIRYCRGDIYIEGPIDELTSFVPASESSVVPHDFPAVRLTPWSGAGWDTRLEQAGYARAESLNYMELADPNRLIAPGRAIEVRLVETQVDAATFARIQSVGFATGDPQVDDWWEPYLLEQAMKNFQEPDQVFYLGWRDEAAVATTLVVRNAGVSGIYAVVTVPEHRKLGAATTMLERVRRDSLECGQSRVILQAICNSYAETYYAKLGFESRFISQVWRRTP